MLSSVSSVPLWSAFSSARARAYAITGAGSPTFARSSSPDQTTL